MTETEEHKFKGTFVDIIRGQYRKKMSASVFVKDKNGCNCASGGSCKPPAGPVRNPRTTGVFSYKTHQIGDRYGEYSVENISNHSVVILNNVILTFSTIISISLRNR